MLSDTPHSTPSDQISSTTPALVRFVSVMMVVGFDTATIEKDDGAWGLVGIKERAHAGRKGASDEYARVRTQIEATVPNV